jgi:cysteine desulfurase/selenocysteine lyase
MAFDVERVRADFPILAQQINGHPLVYLDNAATTQKPRQVIDAISHYYLNDNSNVHRGAHTLSDRATSQFEHARKNVARFINASSTREIIWTRGTTEGINLVAQSFGQSLKAGDKVLVSAMEHHSNIVPWQMLADRQGVTVDVIPVSDTGVLDLDRFHEMLDESVKLVAVNHVSNALGSVNPVREIIRASRAAGAKTLIDGAQAIAHWPLDVQSLDCDFYVFSGHKLFGPTGIGVLYGKEALLETMPPYQGGGEMIERVSFAGTTYNQLPYKFEAGTPDIAGAIGLSAAIDYLDNLDRQAAEQHEQSLLAAATQRAEALDGVTVIGRAPEKVAILGFLAAGVHPSDLGMLLDQQGVAVRTGHHCAQPIMEQFKISGTVRASFSFYNTHEEIDRLFAALDYARKLLG